MKKVILSILAIGAFIPSFSQVGSQSGAFGFEIGVRGAAESAWFFNQNVQSEGNEQNYAPLVSYNVGLHMAFNFSDRFALEVNGLYGTMTQGYSGTFAQGSLPPGGGSEANYNNGFAFPPPYADKETYTSSNQLSVIEIPVLARLGSGNGAYIEIGPEYDIIQGATYTANYSGQPTGSPSNATYSVASSFATSAIQGVLGFGNDFQIGSTGLNIITNLRFSYDFTDLMGADGFGQNMNQTLPNGNSNPLYEKITGPYYSGYKATHLATASFSLGLYYYIPITTSRGGRTACKHAPKVHS
jgi:hypothetical protein